MAVLAAVAGVAALAVAGVVLWQFEKSWRADALDQHRRGHGLGVEIVREHIHGRRVLIQTLSETPFIRDAASRRDWRGLQARVRAIHETTGEFATVFVVDAAGILRAHSTEPGLFGQDFSGRDYFQAGRWSAGPYLSAPYLGNATRQPTVAIVAPIRDEGGRLHGLLGGALTLENLSTVLGQRLPEGSRTFLVAPPNLILTHPDRSRILQPAERSSPAADRALAGQSGEVEWVDGEGTGRLSMYAPVPETPWGLIHSLSLAEIDAPIRMGARGAMAAGGFLLLLAVGVGAALGRLTVRPILHLEAVARRLGAGDLSARAGLTRRDEIGRLGQAFDTMAESLAATQAALAARVADLDRRTRELTILQQLDQGMLAGAPPEETIRHALQAFASLAEARGSGLVRSEKESGRLFPVASHVPDPEASKAYYETTQPRVGEGAAGQAIATGRPAAFPDVAGAPLGRMREAYLARGIRAILAVPVPLGPGERGALTVTYSGVRPFSPEEIARLQGLGNQVAMVVQTARLKEEAAERWRLEEAQRVKNLFLANMSHELRTPLNAVIGFSSLLEEGLHGPLTEKQRRYLGHIHASGKHLLALINDILDLSKVEAGKIVLDPQTLPLEEILEGAVTVVRTMAVKKDLALTLDAPADLPPLRADPLRLKQILFNLLSNAVKFTPEKGSVTIRASQPEAGWIEVAVADTGAGIAADELPRLFREFVQVSSAEGRKHEGAGLGLALSKRLVELHGGTIRAESPGRGRGSTFTVRLPIVGPAEPAAVEPAFPSLARPEPAVPPLVLVVEDEPEVARAFEGCLADAGYRVLLARDGEEAVHLAGVHRPDVITLDLLLPGQDGWEVMATLKQDPATRGIPVVVVSVVPKTKAGFAAGAVEYLEKPVNRAALLGAVSRYAVPKAGQAPPRVLVVDDDPMVLEMLEDSLGRAGYAVQTASEGESGLTQVRREVPDLMVLDLLMPGLSGFDVLQRIREDRRTADLPVIVYTAAQLTASDRERLNAQMASLVQKSGPIDASLLQEVARHAPPPPSRPA
ncbi:MAG TPA: response regulator [Candidatus Methylomirabilis sp.]|jgi:signal transduction histidine kinase/DNA-binding response OmpR family regulator/HAMP domain-containing protein|nr:response regulator [Candidatus Methylomirabilis sp.]